MAQNFSANIQQGSGTDPRIALGATLAILVVLSAFDKPAPWALGILIFMGGAAWLTAYQNGEIANTLAEIQHPPNV